MYSRTRVPDLLSGCVIWLRRFFWKVGVGYYYYSCKQKFYSMHIMHTVNTLLCILLT